MAGDREDDPTVPTGRAGIDPLIAYPKLSTGQTGQIERPGDQTPWWFIPGLCAVGLLLIGLLVVVADRRADPPVAAAPVTVPAETVAPSSAPVTTPAPTAAETTIVEASVPTTLATTTTLDPRIADLPPAGTVRFDGSDREIRTRCEVHLPFDPVDTEFQTSSYFFFDSSGTSQMIDRISTADGDSAELFRGNARPVDFDEIGDDGAFIASFIGETEFDVVVNPGAGSEQDCGDRVVTNAPGQFAEPHTRIVLDVCIDADVGTTLSGLTSQGARFEILQAGGELAEIVFDPGAGPPLRTTAPAFIIRNEGILSASGVVSNGVNELDITIDLGSTVGEANARPCAPSDRL